MNDPATPPPLRSPQPGNPAITILRIVLWLLPATLIPVGMFMGAFLFRALRSEPVGFGLAIVFIVIATAGIGWFDQRLALTQRRTPPPHDNRELAKWTAIFVLMQLIIAPTICFAALFGICLVAGMGY